MGKSLQGSPPRMRGKVRPPSLSTDVLKDHPRVCGEKNCLQLRITEATGSPPRMRGKGAASFPIDIGPRITPAYAGKRRQTSVRCACRWDHPRVCGEKITKVKSSQHTTGSPPRMRGKAVAGAPGKLAAGITPAYAGKSLGNSPAACKMEDHPRVCGEKVFGPAVDAGQPGSPPRMRGKDSHPQYTTNQGGITPAYAGKRYSGGRI